MRLRDHSAKYNGLWAIVGNISYAVSQWLMLVAIIKFGSTEMAGQFGYALAVTAPIFLLTNLQLRTLIATDYSSEVSDNEYFTIRIITSCFAVFLCAIVFLYHDWTIWFIIIIVALNKLIESLSDLLYGVFQKKELMRYVALSLIVRGVGSTIALSAILYYTKELKIALLGMVLIWFLVLIFYDLAKVRPKLNARWTSWKTWKMIFRSGIPLGFVLMLVSLIENIPRYFIEYYHNEAILGVFTGMVYIRVAGGTIVNGLGQAWSHQIARYHQERNLVRMGRLFKKLMAAASLVGILGVLLAAFLGERLLTFIYNPEFAIYSREFFIIMVSGVFSYLASLIGAFMTAVRIIRPQPYIFASITLVGIIASYLLIPSFGVLGAAYVVLIVSVVQFIFNATVTKGIMLDKYRNKN